MEQHPKVEGVDPLALIEATRAEIAAMGNVDDEHDALNGIRDRLVRGELDAEGVQRELQRLKESRIER